MAGRLRNKTAMITGAGQGIGRAIAEAFIAEGATVWATDIDVSLLQGIRRARRRKLDVRSTRAVERLSEKIGPIDVLVNVAGYVHHGTVLDCSEQDWDYSFDVNAKAMHRTIHAFLPGMLVRASETGGSSIINMASGASSVRGIPNRYVYGASKAAVIGLTKAVAADFIKDNLRCNAICPGTVRSPSLDKRIETLAAEYGSFERALQHFVSRQPMERLGEPEEIAPLAVYMASDESRYMTGMAVSVDGGFSL